MEVLAARLKWLREKRRLGQKEVAGEIGITLSGYQKIEYNESNPKLETLIKIAQFFNITSDFLLGLSDDIFELDKTKNSLMESEGRIQSLKAEMATIKSQINRNNEKILHLELESDDLEEKMELIMLRETREHYEKHLMYMEQKYFEAKLDYDYVLFDYILELYKIPHSKPEKDRIISEYLPLILNVKEDKKSKKIILASLKGATIGTLFWKQDKEADDEQTTSEFQDVLDRYKELFRLNN